MTEARRPPHRRQRSDRPCSPRDQQPKQRPTAGRARAVHRGFGIAPGPRMLDFRLTSSLGLALVTGLLFGGCGSSHALTTDGGPADGGTADGGGLDAAPIGGDAGPGDAAPADAAPGDSRPADALLP